MNNWAEDKEFAYLLNDYNKIGWYQFADKMNPHELRVYLTQPDNEYWQDKYIRGLLSSWKK
jgi:hypothetical protein